MTPKLTGVILSIFPEETYGNFRKKVIWIQELKQGYKNTWEIEFHHDDGMALVHYSENDTVECEIEIQGKYWSKPGKPDRVINCLKCTGLKKV